MKENNIKNSIREKITKIASNKEIKCVQAFKIANDFGFALKDVGAAIDSLKYKDSIVFLVGLL